MRGATYAPKRSEVPEAERWNAESVFATPDAWEDAFEALRQLLPQVDSYVGTLTNPDGVAAWLAFAEDLEQRLGKLYIYASMDYSCDTLDEAKQARYERVRALLSRVMSAFAFAEPELLSQGEEVLTIWTRSPNLAPYAHYVATLIAKADHTRSAEVETLLGALSSPFSSAASAHGVLANTDLNFADAQDAEGQRHALTQTTVGDLLSSPDPTLRENAYAIYSDAHLEVKNTVATLLGTGVKQNVFMARARRYPSALAAALAPSHIPERVFHTLLDTFRQNLPTWHRYWRARRELLGVTTLRASDIFAPLAKTQPVISFEQAVGWLERALAPLGSAYTEAMVRGALEERWVDRAPNRGKRMGAFSSGVQGTHPFIMMPWSNDMSGMSTLAHELGHSLHSYLTWQTQPPVYSSYSLFVAEVASNFNQAMLRAHLFGTEAKGDRDFELALIDEAMRNFHRYFFVMPTLARFELEIHERTERGESLSAASLIALMADLLGEGYGDALSFDREREGIMWAKFHTHLYSNFYVYQYATGIAGAHALAAPILEGDEAAAKRYMDFLKAGGSDYPLEVLRRAGVDLSSPEPVEATFEVLDELVGRLEALAA